jgi:hypothetical protein
MPIVLAPTVTVLPEGTAGAVLVTGSHGGLYPGVLAGLSGARAVIVSDAGIGREEAGVASLPFLGQRGMAAAAVSVLSARIGDAADMMSRGIISRANAPARALGVRPGMTCAEAAKRLEAAPTPSITLEKPYETRRALVLPGQRRAVTLSDSAALIDPIEDARAILITGSHGGLIGGDPAKAVKAEVFAVLFNDAGIGIDEAGTSRLPALDQRRIAGATVAALSARIGDAGSTYADGILSRVNETAYRLGAREGMPARDVVARWAALPDR